MPQFIRPQPPPRIPVQELAIKPLPTTLPVRQVQPRTFTPIDFLPQNAKPEKPWKTTTTTEGALPYWVAFGLPEDWKVANTTQWWNYKPFWYEPEPGENIYYSVNSLLKDRRNKLQYVD